MEVVKVEVFNVNNFLVCAIEDSDIEEYLSDVPVPVNKELVGTKYVVAVGKEFKQEKCKEINHMKINTFYETPEEAQEFINSRLATV